MESDVRSYKNFQDSPASKGFKPQTSDSECRDSRCESQTPRKDLQKLSPGLAPSREDGHLGDPLKGVLGSPGRLPGS